MPAVRQKAWWQSKTVWVGVIGLLIGAAEMVVGLPFLGDEVREYGVAALAVLMLVLRFVTELPAGLREGIEHVE